MEEKELVKLLSYTLLKEVKECMDKELQNYIEETKPSEKIINVDKNTFFQRALNSRIIYIGEMHNSKTITSENYKIFRQIFSSREKERCALCLEFIPYDAEIIKYIYKQLSLKELFSQISSIEKILPQEKITGKVFRKENYKELLKYCRKHKIYTIGIDKREENSLVKRDILAAKIISEICLKYDYVVVIGGNHHIHPLHLPRIIEKKISNTPCSYLITDHEQILHFNYGLYEDKKYSNLFFKRLVKFKEFFDCYFKILEFNKEGRKVIFLEDLVKRYQEAYNKKLWLTEKDRKYLEKIAPIKIMI